MTKRAEAVAKKCYCSGSIILRLTEHMCFKKEVSVKRFVYPYALIGFGLVGAGCSDKEVGSGSVSALAVAGVQEEVV